MAGRIFTFILGALLTLYLAVLYKSVGLLFVFYAEILIGSAMFIIALLLFCNIKVRVQTEHVVDKDGEIKFELIIENRGILPSGKILLLVNCLDPYTMKSKKIVIKQWCSCKNEERNSYSFRGKTGEILSGKYIISVKKMSIYDYLGFFKFTRRSRHRNDIDCVVPVTGGDNTEPLDNICDEIENIVNIEKSHNGEFSRVREYANGDKIRNIHWKLSSKSDELYVKEFLDGSENYLCYYIETRPLKRQEISDEFKKWNVAGEQVIESGRKMIFIWYDTKQKYVRKANVSNREELYEALCEINVYDGTGIMSNKISDKNLIVDMDMLMEMEKKS